MDYEHKAKAVGDCLMGYKTDESGWKVCKKSNDVVVSWRPSSEFPGNLQGGGGYQWQSEKVWECLKPVPNGIRVNGTTMSKGLSLWNKSQRCHISICRTVTPSAAMGIIAPRDFVDVILIKQYEDGTISSNATNVSHPSCPPQSGYVRGFNHPCGCICVPISGAQQNPGVQLLPDRPGGLLPRSVVDSFFPSSMAEFYSNLARPSSP
ncbi:hypothetical protein F7725_027026 [Dissostichus mawsoni]|uniref:START domain-containing protein n=1 Tax=Dissostichus mawsoni TaxID=36200 RepID=A0A7J5X8Y4_DISMA|nr:hypothetical protein F7725_027026 [Dissostichus mawsoni]